MTYQRTECTAMSIAFGYPDRAEHGGYLRLLMRQIWTVQAGVHLVPAVGHGCGDHDCDHLGRRRPELAPCGMVSSGSGVDCGHAC